MLVSEAMDLVDAFGADQSRWPSEHQAEMQALLASDAEFKAYVDEIAQLDSVLDNWEEGEDGTPINEDDLDGDGEDDDDDQRDEPPADPEGEQVESDEKPETGSADSEDEGGGGAGAPIDIDMDDVKDADEALADILRQLLNGGFDSRTQTHLTRDYDVIEPYKTPKHVDGVDTMEAEVKQVAGTLQKELQRLMVARAQSYFTPGFRSGRLNAPSLHRLRAGDDRVFRRKHVAETNKVAVSLVCDLSGSMRGTKVRTALLAAWAFSEVLDKLRIPNEVCGFTNHDFPKAGFNQAEFNNQMAEFIDATGLPAYTIRWMPVWMPIFKGYDEKFTQETKRRLTHMALNQKGMMANNDACAIEFAGERLRRRLETRKIMIVFSDGQPADYGVDDGVLNQSVVTNIANLEKQGVEIIGVGIQDATVKKFYKKAHVIHRVQDLPKFVMGELKALLLN